MPDLRIPWLEMDILSEVLEVLDLKCTSVHPISPSGTHTGRDATLQAYFVVSGACTLRFMEDDAEYRLRPLDCVLLADGDRHEIESGPGKSSSPARLLRCVYALDRSLPHPLAHHLPRRLPLRSRDLTDESELGRAAWLLEGELINARLGFDFVAQRIADIMLVEMLRRCQLDGPEPVFLTAFSDPVIHEALEQIHRRLDHPWHVPELAKSVGLSRTAFTERFHHRVGEPPLRYIRYWRMLKARRELRRTSVPIKDVAAHAGYESAAGFRRAFRRVFGRAPSRMR